MPRVAECAYCESWIERTSSAPCASCGKPTNGAPVRVFSSAESNSTTAIAVIVFVLAGVVILSILAAMAMPNFSELNQQADQKRTLASIRTVGALVEAYAQDNNVYPRAETMAELQPLLIPKYGTAAIPLLDEWGNDLRYGCIDEQCRGYAITSAGADRIFEQFYASKYAQSATTHFDCDIVFVNGAFVQYPASISR